MDRTDHQAADPSVDQIGIVVRDLHAMVNTLSQLLGINNFRVMEWPIEGVDPQATYHGEPGDFKLLLAFATIGKTQIEIVQPLEGKNIYSDFLEEHGPGLHHFRLTVPDFEERVEGLEANGIKKIASGTGVHVGSEWAYFDTSELLQGVIIELRKHLTEAGGEGRWVNANPEPSPQIKTNL
jgi:hypothetical protein